MGIVAVPIGLSFHILGMWVGSSHLWMPCDPESPRAL